MVFLMRIVQGGEPAALGRAALRRAFRFRARRIRGSGMWTPA